MIPSPRFVTIDWTSAWIQVGASQLFNIDDEDMSVALGYLCGGAIRNSQTHTKHEDKAAWSKIFDPVEFDAKKEDYRANVAKRAQQ